jgi:hypothetical protein
MSFFSENLSKNFSFFALGFPENGRAGRNRPALNFLFLFVSRQKEKQPENRNFFHQRKKLALINRIQE